ncbi:MAG: hypothetical protein JWO02_3458 [Solirubrobacterales bacterium]|nr:hypothetical protein [Solirubrobacterales bacterium]
MQPIQRYLAAVLIRRREQQKGPRQTNPTRGRAAAVATAMGLLAMGAPAAQAGAASPPTPHPFHGLTPHAFHGPTPHPFHGPALPFAPLAGDAPGSSPLIDFSPPAVGEITVAIGPTIIGGQVINPGLVVTKPTVGIKPR